MSFQSSINSNYNGVVVYSFSQGADSAKASGVAETMTLATVPPAGYYMVSTLLHLTGASLLTITSSGTSTASTFDVSKLNVAVATVLNETESSGSAIIFCDGVNPIVVTTTCTTSAGNWTLKAGSGIKAVRIA